jgi:hypothetical protein
LKSLSVHFDVHTSLQIIFLTNSEKSRSSLKMKPCLMKDLEIGKKKQKRVVMYRILTVK